MVYIMGITIIFLIVFLIQKLLLPAKYQRYMGVAWVALVMVTTLAMLMPPYRFERILYDLKYFLG